jgi:hypothetical protein
MTVGEPSRSRKLAGFCLDDYVALLRNLLELGYRDVAFAALVADERTMFVRHDVDLCLDRAVAVSQAEASVGISATYYLLVSTQMYNIASVSSRRQAHAIARGGHRIGLHFDATQYCGSRDELEGHARFECETLERLVGVPVSSISFHRPTRDLVGMTGQFAGRRHTYEPCFFHQVGYISDSSGAFFRGHPLDHPSVKNGRAIQLLTHPIWWHSNKATSANTALEQLRRERVEALEFTLAAATAKAPRKDLLD